MDTLLHILRDWPWFAWIAIVAIVAGTIAGTVHKVIKLSHRHRERMEMIRLGMDPGAPPEDED